MKTSTILVGLLALGARVVGASCNTPAILNASTNIWKSYALYPESFYRKNVENFAAATNDTELRRRALKVAGAGTFVWLCASLSMTTLQLPSSH